MFLRVLGHSKLHEDVLERFVLLQAAESIDAVVRHHHAVGQDHDVGAHLLDHFDHVRAHQDGAPFVRERLDHRAQHQSRRYVEAGERLVEHD